MQGSAELAAVLFQPLDQVFFEQRVEHDAGRFGDFGQHAIELLLRAHHRIEMLDRRHVGVLRRGRARHRDQRFAGRVGHQMEMEIAGVGHLYKRPDELWTAREKATALRPVQAGRTAKPFNIRPHDCRRDAAWLAVRIAAQACGQRFGDCMG